jgi:hypothetical protein
MDESELIFEDPPEQVLIRKEAQGARYVDFAVALREHKGRWAVCPAQPSTDKSAQALAQNIRRGQTKAFAPKGSFDAVCDGTKVYVMYKGEPKPKDPSQPAEDSGTSAGDDDEAPAKSIAPKIRAWAKSAGLEVPDHGRLPRGVIDKYFDAHPEEERPKHLVRVV